MKSFSFSHWDLACVTKGLLFFAQSMEEMLFHYGHDSLKTPALNFRFLCMEVNNTIKKIDAEVIDKGNLKPLFEELKNTFEKDPIARCLYGNDFSSLFYAKDVEGEYQRNCSDLFKDPSNENSMKRIRKTLSFLLRDMGINDKYYATLRSKIEALIRVGPFCFSEAEELYQLIRILLTDLINNSYSQEYIYLTINSVFYNPQKRVTDISEVLTQFWDSFDFQAKEYIVFLPLKQLNFKNHLIHFSNISVKGNTEKLFGNSCKWVIEVSVKAMDPENARLSATVLVDFFISLIQFNNHKSSSFSASSARVKKKDSDITYDLKAPIDPLRRSSNLGPEQNNAKIASMVENFSFSPQKLINAVQLHSSAINSKDIDNQLLNLWTIIEILVPTEPKNSFSKINQICNTLTSILNSRYVKSLIGQLMFDLKHCIPEIVGTEMSSVIEIENNIEKLLSILVLPKYQGQKDTVINALERYPLLQYRIWRYSDILSNRVQLKDFLHAHRKRISWQIMRIYRNRNMIVHDGSHFPYVEIIVQNLHHYVDCLIDIINIYAGKGYTPISTIYTAVQQDEYRCLIQLEEKENDGSPKQITSDFINTILGTNQ